MKIVVVAPRFPFPLDKGDRLTIFHLLKYFSKQHQVSLVCFLEPGQDSALVEKVAPFCEHVETVPLRKSRAYTNAFMGLFGRTPLQLQYYRDRTMAQAVHRVITAVQPDLLYAHLIRMGSYIDSYRNYARVVAFNVSMTLNYRRLAKHTPSLLGKMFYLLEYHKLRRFEAEFARHFDRVLLISKHDLSAIEQKTPLNNIFFNPHGVDAHYFTPDTNMPRIPNSLIFTGNMNYTPNIDAAQYFCQDILPSIRIRVPDIKLFIVGADPSSEIKSLAQDPSIRVTGRVPDLREYMNRTQIAIAPIRIGAGLQNKVLEGMSMRMPMVITSVANEGIQAIDGQNVLIADSPEDFTDRIISLLCDTERQSQIGARAREFIVQNWSWEKHFGNLEQMFIRLINEKAVA